MAELLLTNAHVYGDGAWQTGVDAIAIRDGVIVGLGSSAELAGLVPAAEVVDLDGGWVLPGFQDAHVHPVQAGLEMNACNLADGQNLDDYVDTVAAYALAHPEPGWIVGGGWSMDAFPGGVPTAEVLDRIVPDRPVFLPNRDHHSAWVNTAALELAGITAGTPDPTDGRIERNDRGEPTGALHEGAMELVRRHVPRPSDDDIARALQTAQAHLHSLGITGWQDALVGEGLGMPDVLDAYLAAQRAGTLTAAVVGALWWDRERGDDQIADLIERRERAAAAGFDASTVKIMQDGVCETFTAAVVEPYLDRHGQPTDNHGLSFIEAADLARYVQLLDAADFQVHIHALGDRAVADSLDAIEHAVSVNGRRGNRHHLAHVQIVRPEDVPRFAELDVTANAQPLWACLDDQMADLTLPFLSAAAREQQYVFRSLADAGTRVAFGSDWPVSSADPLLGMHVAVNRVAAGSDAEPLLAGQNLTVVEAIEAYTRGSAFVSRRDESTGILAVGMAADLAVLDADIVSIDSHEIGAVRVTRTYAAGRPVHTL
ncbi:amidohydrolase [Aeromicrobium ginsengisoli]|uniref:Amidohydrolase n=1 Tax=Aeromicrobium ginsengisoli TaxID=363867 RepID=A0A5M4FBH1_9ACTN|nr:amidohydrolase [Aeromicrobium ginsengisoli]KAA1395232.1 amidohydrolase [Aeromicrobium ginsengisoli]